MLLLAGFVLLIGVCFVTRANSPRPTPVAKNSGAATLLLLLATSAPGVGCTKDAVVVAAGIPGTRVGAMFGAVTVRYEYLDASISEAYAEVERDGHYCEATKIRCQLAACFGVEACAQAVDLVHQASGSTAIRIEHGIERHHRDIHVLTQHAYKSTSRYEDVGKMLFGLPPTFWTLRL